MSKPSQAALEEKITYLERQHDELNEVVVDQQNQLDRITKDLAALRLLLADQHGGGGVVDTPPPHW